MDEKTERLRDIFLDLTEEETVTESQEQSRGSLHERGDIDERLSSVIAEMDDRYDFRTSLDHDDLVTLLRRFYEDASDTAIAGELDLSRRTVVRARLELHLTRDHDWDAPFDVEKAGRRRLEGATVGELAEDFDVSESTIRRYLRVFEAEKRSREANRRFRDEFDTILADADLSTRMAREIHEDGLEEATEGLESNVSF